MTKTSFKGLLAATAFTVAGVAIAQSTPPNPAAKNPAIGAGQQSTQTTPMGTTGTPNNAGGSTSGAMGASGSGSTAGTGTSGSSSTMGAGTSGTTGSGSSASGSAAGGSTMATDNSSGRSRADRN